MVINELLAEGITYLKDLEYANPLFEARLILAKVLNVDKSYIYTYGDKGVSEDQCQEFLKLIKKRSTAYPIAYLLNEKQFMGLDLYIEEGVLIPRPDTEILVEYVLDYIKKSGRLDIRSYTTVISELEEQLQKEVTVDFLLSFLDNLDSIGKITKQKSPMGVIYKSID